MDPYRDPGHRERELEEARRTLAQDWETLAERLATPGGDVSDEELAEAVAEGRQWPEAWDNRQVGTDPLRDAGRWRDLAIAARSDSGDTASRLIRRYLPPPRPDPLSAAPSLGQLRAEPDPDVDWLVEGLLLSDGLSLLLAPPKAGKSTLARCLAHAVATGRRWLGRDVRQGVVLHLALEEAKSTVLGHYNRLAAPDEGIHLRLDPPAVRPADRGVWLEDLVSELQPALVVIDPLGRWVRLEDGNSYAETTAKLDPLIRMARRTATHVMLVHHSRKAGGDRGQEALGSTAHAGSVDVVISLKTGARGQRTFYATGRDGVEVEASVLSMADGSGWVDVAGTKAAADLAELEDRILEFLEDQDAPRTEHEIGSEVESGRNRRMDALRRLVGARRIHKSGAGKKGDPYRYSRVSVSVPH